MSAPEICQNVIPKHTVLTQMAATFVHVILVSMDQDSIAQVKIINMIG